MLLALPIITSIHILLLPHFYFCRLQHQYPIIYYWSKFEFSRMCYDLTDYYWVEVEISIYLYMFRIFQLILFMFPLAANNLQHSLDIPFFFTSLTSLDFFLHHCALDFYLWKSGCYVKSIKSNWHANEDGKAIGFVWKEQLYCFIRAIRERDAPSTQHQNIWLSSMAPLCNQYLSIRSETIYFVWALHLAMRTYFRLHAR